MNFGTAHEFFPAPFSIFIESTIKLILLVLSVTLVPYGAGPLGVVFMFYIVCEGNNVALKNENLRQRQTPRRAKARTDTDFSTPDWWRVLGVSPNATPKTVKNAYRKRIKKFHPITAEDGVGNPKRLREVIEANKAYKKHIANSW